MRAELKISGNIKPGTIAYEFIQCIKSIPEEIDLKYNYICLLTTYGFVNVRVDEVFEDGYKSEEVYYPFSPFTKVIPEDYDSIVNMEKEIENKKNNLIKTLN